MITEDIKLELIKIRNKHPDNGTEESKDWYTLGTNVTRDNIEVGRFIKGRCAHHHIYLGKIINVSTEIGVVQIEGSGDFCKSVDYCWHESELLMPPCPETNNDFHMHYIEEFDESEDIEIPNIFRITERIISRKSGR